MIKADDDDGDFMNNVNKDTGNTKKLTGVTVCSLQKYRQT
jgi:hypothetical protein